MHIDARHDGIKLELQVTKPRVTMFIVKRRSLAWKSIVYCTLWVVTKKQTAYILWLNNVFN